MRIAAAGLVLCSCVSGVQLELPPHQDAKSALIAVVSEPEVRLFAVAVPGDFSIVAPVAGSTAIYVLYYRGSLDELQLSAGEVPAGDRSLPLWDRAWLRSKSSEVWVEDAGGAARALAEVRIPRFDVLRCVAAGGCLESAQSVWCSVPCPTPSSVVPPEPPFPPSIATSTCAGSDEAWIGGLCEPPRVEFRRPCPEGQAVFFGELSCSRVGRPCPIDQWPEDLPATGVVYVSANAPPGGDGSLARPWSTLAEAAVVSPGTLIAVAEGDYPEAVELGPEVGLRGACPERTRIGFAAVAWPVSSIGVDTSLSDVSLIGGKQGALFVREDATMHVDGVIVEAHPTLGVVARGVLSASRLVIRDRLHALTIEGGGRTGSGGIERVNIEGARNVGVSISDSTAISELRSVIIRDVIGDRPPTQAIVVHFSGQVEVFGLLIEDVFDSGITVCNRGSRAEIEDGTIRDVVAGSIPELTSGGVLACDGAVFVARGLSIYNVEGNGISGDVAPRGSELDLSRIVIRDVRRRLDGMFGQGIALGGGSLDLNQGIIRGTDSHGIAIYGEPTVARVRGLVARDIGIDRPLPSFGIMSDAALLDAREIIVERTHAAGIRGSELAPVTIADAIIRRANQSGMFGGGIALSGVEVAMLERVAIEDSHGTGLAAVSAQVSAHDLAVRRASAVENALGFVLGNGIDAHASRLELARVLIEEPAAAGLLAYERSSIFATDLIVRGAQQGAVLALEPLDVGLIRFDARENRVRGLELNTPRFAEPPARVMLQDVAITDVFDSPACAGDCMVAGLAVFGATPMTLDRFEISRSEAVGLLIDGADQVSIRDGQITQNQIGASLLGIAAGDLIGFVERVTYSENIQDIFFE